MNIGPTHITGKPRLTVIVLLAVSLGLACVYPYPRIAVAQATEYVGVDESTVSTTALTVGAVSDGGNFPQLLIAWTAESTDSGDDPLYFCGIYVRAASSGGGTFGPWGEYSWTATLSPRQSTSQLSYYVPLPGDGDPFGTASSVTWELQAYPIYGTQSECTGNTANRFSTAGLNGEVELTWQAADYRPNATADAAAFPWPNAEDTLSLHWTSATSNACCALDLIGYQAAVTEYCPLLYGSCQQISEDNREWMDIMLTTAGRGTVSLSELDFLGEAAHVKIAITARTEMARGVPSITDYVLWGEGDVPVPASNTIEGPPAHNTETGVLTWWTTTEERIGPAGGPVLAPYGGTFPAALIANSSLDQAAAGLTPVEGGGTQGDPNIYIELKPQNPSYSLSSPSSSTIAGIEIRVRDVEDPADSAHTKTLVEYTGNFSKITTSQDGRGWRVEVPGDWREYFEHPAVHRPQVEIQIVASCLVPARKAVFSEVPMTWDIFGKWYCPHMQYTNAGSANDVLYGPIVFAITMPEAGAVLATEGTDNTDLWVLDSQPAPQSNISVSPAAQVMPGPNGKVLDLAAGEHWIAVGSPDAHLTEPRDYSVRLTRIANIGLYGQPPELSGWGPVEVEGYRGVGGRWQDFHSNDTQGYHVRITYTDSAGEHTATYDQGDTTLFNILLPADTSSALAEVRGWVFGGNEGTDLEDGRTVPAGALWVTPWSFTETHIWGSTQKESGIGGPNEPEPTVSAALGSAIQTVLAEVDAEESYGPAWMLVGALAAALAVAGGTYHALKKTAMAATAGLLLAALFWIGLGPRVFGVPEVAAYMPIVVVVLFGTLVVVRSLR